MERNNLKVISSTLFENNKQRLSMSFAYNELDFKNKILDSNKWINSPFIHTRNLHMLNLSHNKIKEVSKDLWTNGHENIDLSFNFIKQLWVCYRLLLNSLL